MWRCTGQQSDAVQGGLGPLQSETVAAYEVGSKIDLLDRRLRLNLAFYYNDYKDMQVFTFRQAVGRG